MMSFGLKVDHLPSASTEAKNEWSILVLLPYTLMACTLHHIFLMRISDSFRT